MSRPANKLIIFLITISLIYTFGSSFVFAAPEKGKLVLLIIDHLNIEDLADPKLVNIKETIAEGAIGLMNTNTAGRREPENTYSTIANGTRSLGSDLAPMAFNRQEEVKPRSEMVPTKAQRLYSNITGTLPTAQVLHLGVARMLSANEELLYKVEVGSIGSVLQEGGVVTAVFGNSDAYYPSRLATLMAIDRRGQVSEGVVDERVNQRSENFPFSKRTDYKALSRLILQGLPRYDYIVVETGDLSRLEAYKDFLELDQYARLRQKSLSEIDSFLGDIKKVVDWNNSLLVILSPTPKFDALELNNTVTPILMRGKDIPRGLLTSNSTRRGGIVTNTDVAPTIVAFWDLKQPSEMVGNKIFSTSEPLESGQLESTDYLRKLNNTLVNNYNYRPIILKTFVTLQIIYVLTTLFMLSFVKSQRLHHYLHNLGYFLMLLPLVLLGFKLYRTDSLLTTVFFLLLASITLHLLLASIRGSYILKVFVLTFLTSVWILVDTLTGSNFIMNSPLGYDPLAGARYYGLGNEFTGVLIGSTLLAFGALFQLGKVEGKKLYLFMVGYFIVLIYLLYAPSYGADAGGLITAVLAFGYYFLELSGHKVKVQQVVTIGIIALLLLVLGGFVDFYLNQASGSHIGRAFFLIISGNWTEFGNILYRKVLMNFKLIKYSIWTHFVLASLLTIGVAIFQKNLLTEKPMLITSFKAIFVAALVGFILNDSGILQAATTLIYLIFPLLQLLLQEKLKKAEL